MAQLQVLSRKSSRVYETGPLLYLTSAALAFAAVISGGVTAALAAIGDGLRMWWMWIPVVVFGSLWVFSLKAHGTRRFRPWRPGPRPESVDSATEARVAAAFERRRAK